MAICRSLDALETSSTSSTTRDRHKARISIRSSSDWWRELDVVSVLGGEAEEGRGDGRSGLYGHTGCINALNWSTDGTLLASGSDDTRICLWKIGQEPLSSHPAYREGLAHTSPLGFGLAATIHTGHRANIFSVKFSPSSNNVLFSCAGDHEVRILDIAAGALNSIVSRSSSEASHSSSVYAREWIEYPRHSGVCTRVLKCHRGRVKRIATEASDAVFLTCSEDGTVRQHDLRVGHQCKSHCPPPLCSYRHMGMGLYSLSTTPLRPELFVVAGTSEYAYLHDRRMIPRTMKEQWGVQMRPEELTQCVRRFGAPQEPEVDAAATVPQADDEDNEDAEDDDELDTTTVGPHPESRRSVTRQTAQAAQRNAERRAAARLRRRRPEQHVTAAKLSTANGRELLLTYSGGPVCLYDIFAEPERLKAAATMSAATDVSKSGSKAATLVDLSSGTKRTRSTRSSNGDLTQTEAKTARHSQVQPPSIEDVNARRTARGMPALSVAEWQDMYAEDAAEQAAPRPEDRSDFVEGTSLQDRPVLQRDEDNDTTFSVRPDPVTVASRPAAPRSSGTRQAFEIRVGDDGEIEMAVETLGERSDASRSQNDSDSAREDGDEPLVMEMNDSDSDDDAADDDDDDDDDNSEDDEEAISDSDDPATPDPESVSTPQGQVPLVRPHRTYSGHRNIQTVKDVNFGGLKDEVILSGSDDGNLFIWDKATSELLGIIEADGDVVNVMTGHPTLPLIAVSGIDNSVKLVSPTHLSKKAFSKLDQAEAIRRKNKDDSWSSSRLMGAPSALIQLLSEMDEGGEPGSRTIPLARLMQLANEGGAGDRDCIIM